MPKTSDGELLDGFCYVDDLSPLWPETDAELAEEINFWENVICKM
jgi:hypothetical protein